MRIYISKNNQQLGPFEESQVLEGLKTGQFSPDDMAIRKGENEWQSLRSKFPNVASASQFSNHSPVAESSPPIGKSESGLSMFRVAVGVLFVILFLVAHLYPIIFPPNLYESGASQYIWIAVSAACLALCFILLLLLIFGVGAKKRMSRWRTPLFCALVMLWCFGLGSYLFMNFSSPSKIASRTELLELMKDKGFKENDLIYQSTEKAIQRDYRLGMLNYGLLALGVVGLAGIGVSTIVAKNKNIKLSDI